MTCLSPQRPLLTIIIFALSALLLSSCTTTPKQQQAAQTPLTIAITQLNEHLTELSQITKAKQTIKPISDCRFEISSQWQSEARGFYRATHTQRFSFKHDLRAVDHSPSYYLNYDSNQQHWQERLQLTFNRLVPYQFSYYDTKTFEFHQIDGNDDQFSFIGFSQAPITLMKAIEATLTDIALQCGNDLSKRESILQKLIGDWEISNHHKVIGKLSITSEQASLLQTTQTEQIIHGPYHISRKDDYFVLTITPKDQQPQSLALDFIHSNYARVLLISDPKELISFQGNHQPPAENSPQLNLFRLGDLL